MGRYSPADVREVRRCIEIPSARLAAARRTERDIGEIAAILARLDARTQAIPFTAAAQPNLPWAP